MSPDLLGACTRPTTRCEAKSTSSRINRKLFQQLRRDESDVVSHTPRHPLQNYLWRRATPWLGKCQMDNSVRIPAHARTAHNGLPQKRPEDAWSLLMLLTTIQLIIGLNLTKLKKRDKGNYNLLRMNHKCCRLPRRQR